MKSILVGLLCLLVSALVVVAEDAEASELLEFLVCAGRANDYLILCLHHIPEGGELAVLVCHANARTVFEYCLADLL